MKGVVRVLFSMGVLQCLALLSQGQTAQVTRMSIGNAVVDPSEICAVEMNLLQDLEKNKFVQGANVVAIKRITSLANVWDQQHGVTMAEAGEILSFVGSVSTTLWYMVEVQWATSHRGVVRGITQDGIVLDIWYVFKYADKWHRLWSRGGFPRD